MEAQSALDTPPVIPNRAAAGLATLVSDPLVTAPLVSIIIPCYNGEAYLDETLQSALAQTHPHVEVIVIDDGSTDRSGVIAQSYPVSYIRQKNSGLTPSRNLGIRMSRGSFIVFLDADDRLKPDAIEIGLRSLQERPDCAMTVGDHLFVSADGSFLANSQKRCLSSAHYEALLGSNFIEMISSVLFRKSVFAAAGLFDEHLRVAEDYELYLRIAREYTICCHPAVVAEYRLHKNNVSRNSELMLTMTLDVLKGQEPFVHGSAVRKSAYLGGKARWRKQYGRQLASELATASSARGFAATLHKLSILLRYYPQGVTMLLLLKAMPGLRRKTRRDMEFAVLAKLQLWAQPSKSQSRSSIG